MTEIFQGRQQFRPVRPVSGYRDIQVETFSARCVHDTVLSVFSLLHNQFMKPTTGVYAPYGRLDGATASAAEQEVKALLEAGKTSLVIDLAQIDYVSSAGLRVLLVAAKGCRAQGGQAVLAAVAPGVLEVLRMSGFDKLLKVLPDRDAAVAQVEAGS